jgi:hypothetical protein
MSNKSANQMLLFLILRIKNKLITERKPKYKEVNMRYISVNDAAEYGRRHLMAVHETRVEQFKAHMRLIDHMKRTRNDAPQFIPRIPTARALPLVPVATWRNSHRIRCALTRMEKAALLLGAAGTLVGRLFRRPDTGPETR